MKIVVLSYFFFGVGCCFQQKSGVAVVYLFPVKTSLILKQQISLAKADCRNKLTYRPATLAFILFQASTMSWRKFPPGAVKCSTMFSSYREKWSESEPKQ